jgi:hypothetical protein
MLGDGKFSHRRHPHTRLDLLDERYWRQWLEFRQPAIHGVAGTHPYTHAHADTHSNADAHTHAYAHSDSDANPHPNTYTDAASYWTWDRESQVHCAVSHLRSSRPVELRRLRNQHNAGHGHILHEVL